MCKAELCTYVSLDEINQTKPKRAIIMNIVNVIPIAKSVPYESLSYFTSKKVSVGALVSVPIRNKIIPAIVSSVEEAKRVKSSLKSSEFALKPIKSIKTPSFLTQEFIEACNEISHYFVSPVGSVIKDFVPQAIMENASKISDKHGTEKPSNARHEIILMQAPKQERFQYYRSVIREEFARNHSILFCLPTILEINEFAKELQKGIEQYTLILHNKLSRKKINEGWNKAVEEKHPLLIISTKSFLSLPRKDINTIIVDCENSTHYKLQRKPYTDVRKAAEIISKKTKTKLIFGDFLLRTETLYRQEAGDFPPPPTPPSRMLSSANQLIVDMKKKQEDEWQKSKIFPVISPELKQTLEESYQNNENTILFINRRGYSPTTVCNDCMRTISCSKCDTPLVLHKKNGKKMSFVCHKCLKNTPTIEKCPYCNGWRLNSYGIGIQKIAEEVSRLFPKFKLFRMDSDSIKNETQGRELADEFLSSPGSILIGTEILFSYIKSPVDRTAVVSLDAIFTLPDFKINEKIFRLLLQTRSLAKKTFLVQTRIVEQEIFEEAMKGNVSGFYRTEIKNREQFNFPPFSLMIKISASGKNKTELKKKVQMLEKKLAKWNPFNYQAFTEKIRGLYTRHLLLKIKPESWPERQKELYKILRSLPLNWRVDINPESLL